MKLDELETEKILQYHLVILALIEKEGEENFNKRCCQPGGHPAAVGILRNFIPKDSEMKFSPTKR
ncbi:hypothetical protein KAS41_01600 [Candidatus Parcubacteria bacterium]|nr:hypothetical protein [Candidatus Parcubacteria bacterium]